MECFDRREYCLLSIGSLFATGAQAEPLNRSMQDAFSILGRLREIAIAINADTDTLKFAIEEYFARKRVVADAKESGLFVNVGTAQRYLKSTIGASRPSPLPVVTSEAIESQLAIVDFVARKEVPLVPDIRDIQPIGIPVTEPQDVSNVSSDLRVTCDIALQTIGIYEEKELIDELLNDKDVTELLTSINSSLQAKDWKRILELADKVFTLITTSKTFERIAAKIGKRVASKLALRLVPIVGWVYVALSFLVALKANFYRYSFAR